jgi:S1-C subfamily serine protease
MLVRIIGAVGALALLFGAPLAANPVVLNESDLGSIDPTLLFMAGTMENSEFGWLGVYIQNITPGLQEAMDLDSDEGVLIDDVVEDSPAEEAGLMKGDIVLRYDGTVVESVTELTEMVRETEPGEEVEIKVNRDGREFPIIAVIGEKEDREFDIKGFPLDLPFTILEGFDMPHHPGMFKFSKSSKPRFGVGIQELDGQLAEFFEVPEGEGVLVTEVYEDSPAEEAGVMAGDVIVEFDGMKVTDSGELISAVNEADAGVAVQVEVVRKGRAMTLKAELPEIEKKHETSRFYIQDLEEDKKELTKEMEELRKELQELKMELEQLQKQQ